MNVTRIIPKTVASLRLSDITSDTASPESQTHVRLVGVVERERPGNVCLDFVLNDATGRIPVRFFWSASEWPLPEYLGAYVRVVGRVVRTNTVHIVTESVALVTEADEISYHCIEAALIYLRQQARQSGNA